MDVEVPTSRGHIPRDKKDSEDDDMENTTELDENENIPHSSYTYTNSSRIVWHEIYGNISKLSWISFFCGFLVVIGVIVKKGFNFFLLHALFMTIGYVGFSTEAMLVLRPFDKWNIRSPNQRIQRNIHKIMNQGTGFCTILGFISILIHRSIHGKSILPHGLHSWFGILVILLVIIQIGAGQKKLKMLQFQGQRSITWHGKLGKLTYILAILTVLLGLVHIYKDFTVYIWISIVFIAVMPVLYGYMCTTKHTGYSVVDQL